MTHAIEAYTAVDNAAFPLPAGERSVYQGKHPLGDMVAEKAIALIGKHLRRAVSHPDDVAAREGMALGATLAGLAFSNVGVAVVHALEYPVGGATHCSHGAGNGLLLPFVMRFNLPARVKESPIAGSWEKNVAGLRDDDAGRCVPCVAVEKLSANEIGIPGRFAASWASRRSNCGSFAERAFQVKTDTARKSTSRDGGRFGRDTTSGVLMDP